MKLTYSERENLPKSSFIFKKKRAFPIEDKAHARNALARASAKGQAVLAKVRRAVKAKYPSIKQK